VTALFKENKLFKWVIERKGFLSLEQCNVFINQIKSQQTLKVKENDYNDDNGKWIELDDSISNSIYNVVKLANDLNFKFHISGVQGCYGKQYYVDKFKEADSFHSDMSEGDITNTATKITTILFLNDDYQGGELQIWDTKIKPEVGKLVIFPSFSAHKIKQFKNKDRFVIATFIGGNHFV
jgi:predicted 2-oxoglutarate/Fe(II)-dependent dioxygenase YbiX